MLCINNNNKNVIKNIIKTQKEKKHIFVERIIAKSD